MHFTAASSRFPRRSPVLVLYQGLKMPWRRGGEKRDTQCNLISLTASDRSSARQLVMSLARDHADQMSLLFVKP